MNSDATPAKLLAEIGRELIACRACPRLVAWREAVANARRRRKGEVYWSRPVPGFGDPHAWLVIIGLAPGAHGSNRTGRMFTGDRSGDWLYRSLHAFGLASQARAWARDDGLSLCGVYVTAAVRCAPPANQPRRDEWQRCRRYLLRELEALRQACVFVCLGAYAWQRTLEVAAELGWQPPRPRPRFSHLAEAPLAGRWLLASYHPSQQNTFTGRLTEAMLDAVWRRALELRQIDTRQTRQMEGCGAAWRDALAPKCFPAS